MEEHDTKVIEISPASSEKERKTTTVIQIKSNFYSSEEEDGSLLRPIFCLNRENNADIKRIEETQDCFILDFDPFESIDLSKLSVSNNPSDADADSDGASDLSVIAEKGQVACRDYPHSRHLCVKFPFETTPHENYCKLCYCYVCDLAAPCKYWTGSKPEHCHASEHVGDWKCQRNLRKQQPAV
ncbi:hypothetical protein FH972_016150 [Carpinus fangiana]|uniref:Uncharacterized protein n=1 Tax=Carpinus fangiana TaxID=176857 RepID=A0A5N6RHR7_9ROSI|nr:hypothetical protein FH972_016150 [Carpinus fangiana]